MEEFSQNGGPEREEREAEEMCWASGIWGLEAAEVMSLEQRSWRKTTLFLYSDPLCSPSRGGEGRLGRQPWQGLLGNGKGCQAGSAANISGSHLCSLKPGVLPKASFQLPAMITLDIGQFLRARNPLCCARTLSLSFKGSLPNMQQFPWRRRAEHKK